MKKILLLGLLFYFLLQSCGIYRPVDARKIGGTAKERARQNIEEGRGVSINSIIKGRNSGSIEFSSSNPLWRASLEILEFLPLSNADYSGGIIITDWYSDNKSNNDSLKITIRFLNNEIQSNSLKIIIHQKKCMINNECKIVEINSKIKEELLKSILAKATVIKKQQEKK